jgi:ferredoxin
VTVRHRIQVDHGLCQGSGLCAGIAPEYFELGSDYKSRPRLEVVDAGVDLVRDAAECCPLEAITLTDADTGEPVSL